MKRDLTGIESLRVREDLNTLGIDDRMADRRRTVLQIRAVTEREAAFEWSFDGVCGGVDERMFMLAFVGLWSIPLNNGE